MGREKVACWSTKAAISLKRVKIEEKLLWRAYRNSVTNALSSGTIPDHLRPPLPQAWGFATPTQNFNRYYLRKGWSYGLQIWPVHSQGPSEHKSIKNLERMERGRIRGLPKVFSTPTISETGKATEFKFGRYVHRVHPNKSPLEILEKRQRGRIQGLPNFFGYPVLSQEQVKLQTSNFVRTFTGSIGRKAQ